MKKKLISMVLALTLVAGMLTGCGGAKEEAPAADNAATETPAEDAAEETATGEQEVLEFYHAYYHEESEWPVAAVMRDIYQKFADEHADGAVVFKPIVVEDVLQVATNEIAGGEFPNMVDFAGNEVPLAAIAQELVIDLKP